MTKAEYLKLAAQSARPGKYGASPSGGYASRKEHSRALRLQTMQRAGLISGLREQVSFTLIPAQPRRGLPAERPCCYVADFVYTDTASGETVVEDVKGYRTPEYVIKRKLMLFIHNIQIRET